MTTGDGIGIHHLTRRFGDVVAVDDISLDIAAREFLVLLGPSGCGKTTLLRMLAGLLEPTSGRILLGERDITHLPPRERDVAMVFQSYALYPHLTVARNLGFGLRARRHPRAEIGERVGAVAEQLGLRELLDRRPRELSGGQRQRVALGRAIVRDPRAFLMDEPLSNLDAKLRSATRAELVRLHRTLQTTFVYVTHDQIEAMTMATRIALLNDGRLEQLGSPVEVYDEPATTFVAAFLGSPPMNLLPADVRSEDGVLRALAKDVDVPLHAATGVRHEITLGVRPEHLRIVAAGAEDDGPLLQGIVDVVENLGSEELATCLVGSARIAVRGPRPLGVAVGDRVTLSAPPERFHLFDRASGRRLVWVSDEAPRTTRAQDAPTARRASATA